MLLQLEQIQNIPVSLYNGNVQFFNQDVVTYCNSTTKTLLGRFQFDNDTGYPKINRVASVTGFGYWQASSPTLADKLFISAYLLSGTGVTVSLINTIISRSQADFMTGHFAFEVKLDTLSNELITLSLSYADTKAPQLETFENSGIDLSTSKIIVEVYGQMALAINPVLSNGPITSPINLVQNPGFEQFDSDLGFNYWKHDQRTTRANFPHLGNNSCSIFSGEVNYTIDQDNSVRNSTVPKGYIYQSALFAVGKHYLIEFWGKNRDQYAYASDTRLTVASFAETIPARNFTDDTQNVSILSVYAYNSTTGNKTLLISVNTTKIYTKTSLVITALPGYDALYFEMNPSSFATSATKSAQGNLYRDVLQFLSEHSIAINGLPDNLPYDPEYTGILAAEYTLYARIDLDDVRVSEITPTAINPYNPSNKEIRLRNFTTQYIS